MKKYIFALVGILLVFSPLVAQAFSIKSGETVFLPENELVPETVIVGGERVEIKAPVNGDVIVAGGVVIINAEVLGDVIAAGGEVLVAGQVMGNIRVAGGKVRLEGRVGKNVTVFAGDVAIKETAEVGWSVLAAGGNVDLRGKVGREVLVAGGNIVISGEVGGDVEVRQGNNKSGQGGIVLLPGTLIGGNLTYYSSEPAEIHSGARIQGEVIYNQTETKAGGLSPFKVFGFSYIFFKLVSLFGLLVIGLVLVSLAKKVFVDVGDRMIDRPWASLGRGLVWFIVTPIVCFLLFITVIGAPLGLITLVLYLVTIYVTRIFAGTTIGLWLLHQLSGKREKKISVFWAMVLGTVIVYLVGSIPIVGWFINFLVAWWALGAMIDFKKAEIIQRYH